MRISIVTPALNQGEFIEQTILSVMQQNHGDVEHLVMDGGSTDNTLAILRKYAHLKWTSERDAGQADAINRGFSLTSGDVLAWLNSDDFYEKNVFGDVAQYFKSHPDCMVLYGDITYVDRTGKSIVSQTGGTLSYNSLTRFPDLLRQPSFFWRRAALESAGGLNKRLRLVMDLDFFLRLGRLFPFHYLAKNFSYYRTYPETKTNSQLGRQAIEIYRVFRRQGIPVDYQRARFLLVKVLDSIGIAPVLRSVFGRKRDV